MILLDGDICARPSIKICPRRRGRELGGLAGRNNSIPLDAGSASGGGGECRRVLDGMASVSARCNKRACSLPAWREAIPDGGFLRCVSLWLGWSGWWGEHCGRWHEATRVKRSTNQEMGFLVEMVIWEGGCRRVGGERRGGGVVSLPGRREGIITSAKEMRAISSRQRMFKR